jgi:hypothetical protein
MCTANYEGSVGTFCNPLQGRTFNVTFKEGNEENRQNLSQ